jgi:DNA-binding LacI/PurR family transcriptional regulator
MTDNLQTVETACAHLLDAGEKVTFTAVAEHTGISRTTLYRNPQFRAVVEEHRSHIHNRHTLTGLAAEISHLRSGLEAVADRVSNQEERLRRLEGRTPRLKAN